MSSSHYNVTNYLKWLVATVLMTLFILLNLVPAAAQQGLTPEQVARIKNVTSATISSDARHVAYTVSILAYEWAGDGNHIAFTAPEELPEPETELPYSPEIFEENIANRKAFITNVRHSNHDPYRIQVDGTIYLMAWSIICHKADRPALVCNKWFAASFKATIALYSVLFSQLFT